jgi:hypothetical protein
VSNAGMDNVRTNAVDSKLAYSAPSLTVFGSVRELTRSGQGSGADGGSAGKTFGKSDPALKENIVRVGEHPAGFGLYLFDYKAEVRDACGHGRRFGVMADEVELIVPSAVSIAEDGYRQVDYSVLGITIH